MFPGFPRPLSTEGDSSIDTNVFEAVSFLCPQIGKSVGLLFFFFLSLSFSLFSLVTWKSRFIGSKKNIPIHPYSHPQAIKALSSGLWVRWQQANCTTPGKSKCGCHMALKCKTNVRSIIIQGGSLMKGWRLTLLSLSKVSWNLSAYQWSAFQVPASPQSAGSSLLMRPSWAPAALTTGQRATCWVINTSQSSEPRAAGQRHPVFLCHPDQNTVFG